MADFRALCAELVEKLDELNCHYNVPSQSAMIERALAALADEPAVPQPQPPAEGEVAELAAKLRRLAPHNPLGTADPTITRAADLLQRLSPPQPVPVSERPWEREGWCDKRGMCWAWNWGICNWWEWVDSKLISYSSGDYTHCLPAHALPIPHQQESING